MAGESWEDEFPGVDRISYFALRVMMMFAAVFAVMYFGPESTIFRYLALILSVAGVVLDVMRLRNIGASQWLMFLRFVPYAGLFLSVYLQSAQSGWIETKRFDRAGWWIISIHAAIAAFFIYLLLKSPTMEIFGLPFGSFMPPWH